MLFRTLLFSLFCFSVYSIPHSEEIDLRAHEVSLYSENGEDGVIAYLFQKLGVSSRYFVELGAGDAITHSNTYILLLQAWDGLSLDRAHDLPPYNLHKEFITKENVNTLLNKYGVPYSFDLLSIRTAYNAFYIWKGISSLYQPAVVAIRFNGFHPPHADQVVSYRPFYIGDKSDYFGASILALYKLGREKGYSLVYAEMSGHTLFFVRDDLIESKNLHFKNMNQVEALYQKATYQCEEDTLDRTFTTAEEILKK